MGEVSGCYESRRAEFTRALAACADAREAADCAALLLERLKRDYFELESDRFLRAEADRLFGVAAQAILCVGAVRTADVRLPPPVARGAASGLRKALAHAPGIACDLLAAWLLVIGQSAPALLALAAALLTHYSALHPQERGTMPAVGATPRADAEEMARRVSRAVARLDQALEDARQEHERRALLPGERPVLSEDMWPAVQMLYEAAYTRDGDYALKAIPRLDAALGAQGVAAVPYSPEHRACFDLLPTAGEGATIRPAMLKDGKLVARGEAAVPNQDEDER